jgi:hypothetical protein
VVSVKTCTSREVALSASKLLHPEIRKYHRWTSKGLYFVGIRFQDLSNSKHILSLYMHKLRKLNSYECLPSKTIFHKLNNKTTGFSISSRKSNYKYLNKNLKNIQFFLFNQNLKRFKFLGNQILNLSRPIYIFSNIYWQTAIILQRPRGDKPEGTIILK